LYPARFAVVSASGDAGWQLFGVPARRCITTLNARSMAVIDKL
jgi:hypothetical protein